MIGRVPWNRRPISGNRLWLHRWGTSIKSDKACPARDLPGLLVGRTLPLRLVPHHCSGAQCQAGREHSGILNGKPVHSFVTTTPLGRICPAVRPANVSDGRLPAAGTIRPFTLRTGATIKTYSMSYRSEPIALAIGRMNRQYFLPAIQREFVWKPEQIVQLFDSIMRGYPISSFLFWELKPENRDKWQVYEFLEKAQHGGTRNQLASTDGVTSLSLVLDGQQRLTSLMIGLRGTYTAKKKYKRWDNPDAWSAQRLHLDLLADPRLDSEGVSESGVYYKFEFMEEAPPPNPEHYWFKIGRILDFDERQKLDVFLDKKDDELSKQGLSRSERKTFERNLERPYQAVHEDEVIAYYTETDQDCDRVLDIFVRANEGGTKLSKSDLLLSMVTSNWDGVNARDEIFNFVDRVNTQLTRRNDFDKDFIMKSCLVLTDLPVAYKVQNFNNANLTTIRQHWPKIKKAVEQGTDLANSFGIGFLSQECNYRSAGSGSRAQQ